MDFMIQVTCLQPDKEMAMSRQGRKKKKEERGKKAILPTIAWECVEGLA